MRPLLFLLLLLAGPATAELDFELPTLDGGSERLSDYRGQWVVVNYWATWCKPCRKEIPDLSDLHDSRDDITVLGLAFEDTEPADFEAFLQSFPASYPILIVDVYDPPADLGSPRVLPTTYLIDGSGAMVETWLGPVTSEMITAWIDERD
ncbi:TlpA family protein disulfide reductase [Wenzhouxiangella sp. XN201]|uniref:redoxin domain-containing protein n=1 Tax=Wenzhouxiangella sp. XN201 TaxID=2710755 RepID=UPI0013CA065E|nr:TlpA family protein disulfide reductase [Wenzhouxiangella sp. XN201]